MRGIVVSGKTTLLQRLLNLCKSGEVLTTKEMSLFVTLDICVKSQVSMEGDDPAPCSCVSASASIPKYSGSCTVSTTCSNLECLLITDETPFYMTLNRKIREATFCKGFMPTPNSPKGNDKRKTNSIPVRYRARRQRGSVIRMDGLSQDVSFCFVSFGVMRVVHLEVPPYCPHLFEARMIEFFDRMLYSYSFHVYWVWFSVEDEQWQYLSKHPPALDSVTVI